MPEERKLATILFADIVGSSALGEARDPEAMRAALDRTFRLMSELIKGYGGTVEKFIGDAVMAVFGVPTMHEDDAERAVRAAFELRQRASEFEIRIGVNTGEVVADTTREGHFLVTGAPVNAAARLQQAATPGEILVGELTRRLTAGTVVYRAGRSIDAKGIGSVQAHPAAELGAPGALDQRGIPGLYAPLVGRGTEMALLRDALERASGTGAPQLVTVYGPPGAGKSRLVREFVASLDLVRIGRCLPYGEGIAYHALQLILEQDARITSDDAPDAAMEKLRARVRETVSADEVDAITARLAVIAGLATPDTLKDTRSSALGDELSWGLVRYLSRRAEEGLLVLVLEDVHWAHAKLLDLVEDLVAFGSGALLVLCMARPEFRDVRPQWGAARPGATAIDLLPLTDADVRTMISALLSIDALPADLRETMIGRTEGNPLYVEEFLRMLMDAGAVQHEGDRWVAVGGIQTTEIPPTLTGVIGARLDRAPADVKQILQYAAVIGRSFSTAGLAALEPSGPSSENLREALRRDLILRADGPTQGQGRIFRFKHALVRDVAYASLTKGQRSRLHNAYGLWLESTAPPTAEFRDLVAYHAEQAFLLAHEIGTATAEIKDRAVDILLDASRRAIHADLRAQVALDERALRVVRLAGSAAPVENELELRASRRAHNLQPSGDMLERMDAALERARALPPTRELIYTQLQRAAVAARADRLDLAETSLAEALTNARAIGDAGVLVSALGAQVTIATWRGTPASRRVWADEALAIARSSGSPSAVMDALGTLRVLLVQGGEYTELRAVHQEIASLSDSSSPFEALRTAFREGQFAWLIGDHEECVRLHTGTRARAEALARTVFYVRCSLELGDALQQIGRLDQALDVLMESTEHLQVRRNTAPELDLLELDFYLAGALVAGGRVDEARVVAERIAAGPQIPGIQAMAEATRGVLADAVGDDTTGERHFRASVQLIARAGWGWATAMMRVRAARFFLKREDYGEARELLEGAREFYRDPLMWRRRAEVDLLLQRCESAGASV